MELLTDSNGALLKTLEYRVKGDSVKASRFGGKAAQSAKKAAEILSLTVKMIRRTS